MNNEFVVGRRGVKGMQKRRGKRIDLKRWRTMSIGIVVIGSPVGHKSKHSVTSRHCRHTVITKDGWAACQEANTSAVLNILEALRTIEKQTIDDRIKGSESSGL